MSLIEQLLAEKARLAAQLAAVEHWLAAYRDAPPSQLAARVLASFPERQDAHFIDALAPRHRQVYDAIGRLRERGLPRIRAEDIATESGVPVNSLRYIVRLLITRGAVDAAAIGWRKGRGPGKTTAVHRLGRRFIGHAPLAPQEALGLAADHPALTEGRTLFPTTVVAPGASPRLLVSGKSSRKIGDRVVKGEWRGFPIYVLTLEERATCPAACFHWATCFGNGMPRARRHRHGPELERFLAIELEGLQRQHPTGFVVRLHQLGDFYSAGYVRFWRDALAKFPALRCFGYTAWPSATEIGTAVAALRDEQWPRFAVRTSAEASAAAGVTTIWRKPESPRVAEGIVCPAQTDATAACGSCGLCWARAAKNETIVFIAHGRNLGGLPRVEREAAE